MENYKSIVFKRAYQLAKVTGKSFAVCLSKAWQLYNLAKKMKNNIVTFYYEKKDGTLRKAKGSFMQLQDNVKETLIEPKKELNYNVFTYFDINANAVRCFKIENLVKTD